MLRQSTDIVELLLDRDHTDSAVWRFPHQDLAVPVPELRRRVEGYAGALGKLGIGQGDRVGFIADNSYELVCLLYATWYLNAVAVPMRPRLSRYQDYRSYVEKCDGVCNFRLVVAESDSIADELSAWAEARSKTVASIRDIDRATSLGDCDDVEAVTIASEDVAVIQFSSGSTGDPKGVVVTHAMMMAQLGMIEDNHGRSRGRKVASSASWLPINHDLGLFIGVLSPIYSACDNLLAPPGYYMKNPARWFGLLSRYRVDFTFSTNSVLATSLGMLRKLPDHPETDLSALHLYIAAEKVSPIIVRRTWSTLARLGCPNENVHVGYGMAENTLGATYTTSGPIKTHWFALDGHGRLSLSDSSDPHAFELASIGIPNDHHEITVRDREDAVLPELMLGELSIESPCVSPGYYNDPRTTALKFEGGRLRTGDLGFRYQGELYFYSRTDDLLIVGGRNIVPDDIELTAESLDFVRPSGSVLLGVENDRQGVVQLHLLFEGDARLSEDEAGSRCVELRKRILDVHDLLITSITVCAKGSIEKTSSGKKRRKVILKRLLCSELVTLTGKNVTSEGRTGTRHEYSAAV